MTLILSGTNGVSDVDGTAATPAVRGSDTNTGIFFPAADTIAFSEGGAEVARFDASGNLGIGTSSPGARLDVGGQVVGFNFACGTGTGSAGAFMATTAAGPNITMYGSTASPANTLIFNTSTGEQARLNDAGLTARQVYSFGTNYITQSNYDVTPTSATLANNGFIDMGSYSGMVVINNYTTGGVSLWLCGGGNTSQSGSVSGGAAMSVTFNSGINGYTIQNLTGATVTLGIFKLRTRPGA